MPSRSPLCVFLCVLALLFPALSRSNDSLDSPQIDTAIQSIRPDAIRAYMRFLSDSLLQGRAPDSREYEIAAHYVATQLESLGLQPGAGDSWYQMVPFRKAVLDQSKSSLVLLRDGKEQPLVDGQDYVLTANTVQQQIDLAAPIVFVGFGISAPDEKYDDYAGIDVHGKIVVMLGGAPSRFSSTLRAYYSDDMVKARFAVTHGVAGILSISLPEDLKRQPWDWVVPQYRAGEIRWLEQSGLPHNPFSYSGLAALNQHAAELLFQGSRFTADQVYEAARKSQPQAFPLVWSAHVRSVQTWKSFQSPNVVARLQGSDPALRDQYVVYTAHIDHLGICPAVDGDTVCHGAVDNASGVASLLEIARAFSSLSPRPRRSLLFVFVTAEEAGLLGSDYFAHFPTVPLRDIVANVNIDEAPGIYFPMKNIVALGAEHSSLQASVERAAHKVGYSLAPDPLPEENDFIRSDQYSFVIRGVPAVNVADGPDSSDPSVHGLDVIKKWLVTRYHTPADNMTQPLDFASTARAAAVNFLVGYDVAQQDLPPTWNPGDFFGLRFGAIHSSSDPRP